LDIQYEKLKGSTFLKISTKTLAVLQFAVIVLVAGLLTWSLFIRDTNTSGEVKKITVNGETTIEASPDEFTFYPYFEKTGTDRDLLRDELVAEANEVIKDLKNLGVAETDMKLDASSYDRWYWEENEEGVITVSLTITSSDEDLVQKVQDYLLDTNAKGQLTPQAVFSEELQKELDKKAVEEAAADARSKAEAQAILFDASLGEVLEIQQGSDSIFVDYGVAELSVQSSPRDATLPVLPGQNDYTQTVTVTYELK
jgi:uncharacterized protein YggE